MKLSINRFTPSENYNINKLNFKIKITRAKIKTEKKKVLLKIIRKFVLHLKFSYKCGFKINASDLLVVRMLQRRNKILTGKVFKHSAEPQKK